MNIRPTSFAYPISEADQLTLGRLQARRRQRLGILLVVVGSIWLGLRLTGWVGDVPMPIDWLQSRLADRVGDLGLSLPQVAYGMLTMNVICVTR